MFSKNSANLSKCAISKVGTTKTKSVTIAFFLLLLLFSFSSLFSFLLFTMILELLGLKTRAF